MTWLWFVGPLVVGLVYALTNWRDRRREINIEGWRAAHEAAGFRRVASMPGALSRMLETTGGGSGGEPIDYFALVPKLAYLAVMGADALQGSEHQTVVAKLDEPSPTFTVRPLPFIEGERAPNTGVQFKKDPEFMAEFLVERGIEGLTRGAPADEAIDKAIRTWLSPPLREALLELPEAWLRIDGKTKIMALTLYGLPDAARIDELLAAADIVFAEYGAGGGPSLLGDDDEEEDAADAAERPPVKAKPVTAGSPGGGPAKAKPGKAKPAKPKPGKAKTGKPSGAARTG